MFREEIQSCICPHSVEQTSARCLYHWSSRCAQSFWICCAQSEGERGRGVGGWRGREEVEVNGSMTEQPGDQSDPRWAGLHICPSAARALKVCLFAEYSVWWNVLVSKSPFQLSIIKWNWLGRRITLRTFGNTYRCHLRTEHARATLRFSAPGASIETL